jgi:hypothetical protein
MVRTSVPSASRWVANECRRVWQVACAVVLDVPDDPADVALLGAVAVAVPAAGGSHPIQEVGSFGFGRICVVGGGRLGNYRMSHRSRFIRRHDRRDREMQVSGEATRSGGPPLRLTKRERPVIMETRNGRSA